MDRVAVLMMAYGGPDSLADVEPYLLDVRGGRPTAPELVKEIRDRYEQIGGRSPLLDITLEQGRALEAELNGYDSQGREPNSAGYRVYVGMRHWYPYIREAVSHIVQDGSWNVIAFCMAPHYSKMSTGAYFQKLREAQGELGAQLHVRTIESWHTHPLFIKALAERIQAAQTGFSAAERRDLRYLFTAHSLPAAVVEQGDPYSQQLGETCRLLAAELGLAAEQWQLAYQSAGRTGARWLGPTVEELLRQLCAEDHKAVIVAPVGFVADHVEVLYDIDIEARAVARACGAHIERPESLNTSPTFIRALADLVRQS